MWRLNCEIGQNSKRDLLNQIDLTIEKIAPTDWIHEFGTESIEWLGYILCSVTLVFCVINTFKIMELRPLGVGAMISFTLVILGGLIWSTVILIEAIVFYAKESEESINSLAEIMNPCVHPNDWIP